MQDQLKNFFLNTVGISDYGFSLLSGLLIEERLNASDFFVREGNLCQKIGFLTEGFAKSYYLSSDGEVINHFSIPQHWIGSLSSFGYQRPTTFSVKAVTDCRLLTLSFKHFGVFGTTAQTDWQKMINYNNTQISNIKCNRQQSIQQQYETLISTHPDLAFALPSEDIAAFLQVPHRELLTMIWGMVIKS